MSAPSDGRALPVRAFWAWPVSTMLLAGVEASVQCSRLGVDAIAWLLAVMVGGALAMGIGCTHALIVTLMRRRRWAVPSAVRVSRWFSDLAVAVGFGLIALLLSWALIDAAIAGITARPIDSNDTARQLGAGVAALTVVPGFVVCWLAMRRAQRLLDGKPAAKWVARSVALLALLLVLRQLCLGPYVLYFETIAPVFAVVAGAAVAGLWLPASFEAARRRVLLVFGPAIVVLALGLAGLHHRGARALLLHDTRLFPAVHGATLSSFDIDGDGDLPRWLGGGDCDGGDPGVSSARPELPGNGVDDNCRFGDRELPGPAASEARPLQRRRVPVFLITIDTVRADHLELDGYERETMPFLTHWAKGGRWFERAYSPSNHTGFSMLAMLAGQSPEFLVQEPEVLDSGGQKFTHWLPHRMGQLGYRTVAINPALVETGDLPAQELRFESVAQGPYDYAGKNRGTRAKQVVDSALQAMEVADDRPLFMWVHISDPHARHESHQHFPRSTVEDAYDDELRWTDLQVARLLGEIHSHHGDEALVVVTSDHGEAFGERGAWGHGFSLYEFDVRVPLVVRGAGVEPGREARPVSLVGLPATILEHLGEPVGPRPTHGSILGDDVEADVLAEAPFFWSEQRMEVALIESRWKLIHNRTQGTYVLFDLEADPGENRNRASAEPEVFERMRERLHQALEQSK